jgi:hypothetical protein
MANYKHFYRGEHKQHGNSRVAVHNNGGTHILSDDKRHKKMAQVKFLWLLLDFVGVPVTILGIIANVDNVKALILFILSAIYVAMRIYFGSIKSKQEIRDKEYDLFHKELKKMEAQSEYKKKNGK